MKEKLFKYIDKQMNDEEKIAFEKELDNNPQLQIEYQSYLRSINELKKNSDFELSDSYYSEVITKFRSKADSKPKKVGIVPKMAYSAIAIVFALTSILIYNNISDAPKLNDITEEMTSEELSSTLDSYYFNEGISEEEISNLNEILVADLTQNIIVDISDSSSYDLISEQSYSSLLYNINDEEADLIYNELINKEFLGD